jgi:hypothetical protein
LYKNSCASHIKTKIQIEIFENRGDLYLRMSARKMDGVSYCGVNDLWTFCSRTITKMIKSTGEDDGRDCSMNGRVEKRTKHFWSQLSKV